MKSARQLVALFLATAFIFQFAPSAKGCGPETLQPLFVMQNSPDPPFTPFTQGNVGIVKPSFGRKTLVIAYRYLNGGAFTEAEQEQLVEALKGNGPEPDPETKIKEWVEARKLVRKDEVDPPEIYRASQFGTYDFFPNCTGNAFEVAIETLKDRAGRFGAEDQNVSEWLNGQDTVFQNCSDSFEMPATVGTERPQWLRKDRDYQIAASYFYSLQFDEAVKRFEQISKDNESDWQPVADYLVGRTLVRQASLESDEAAKQRRYETAESYLRSLSSRTSKYRDATRKLLGLVKYRLRPEERLRELAQVLMQGASTDLRQELIDYVWLLDKFDDRLQKEEEARKKLLNPDKNSETSSDNNNRSLPSETQRNADRPDLIDIRLYQHNAAGQIDYAFNQTFSFKPDVSTNEVLKTIETTLGRKLTPAEFGQVTQQHTMALYWRRMERSPNRKLRDSQYEGCYYECKSVPLAIFPSFLRADELSDWIFTFQSKDPQAYAHAFNKWRDTQSPAWFVAALAKADKTSKSIPRLLAHAEQIDRSTPMFATVAYNRVRLLIDVGKQSEARKLLDEVIQHGWDNLPVSAQNEFLEQRLDVAENLQEFLKFAPRKPVAFYVYGQLGTLNKLLDQEHKWYGEQPAEEIDEQEQERVKKLLEWDNRVIFDERVADILNWHFTVSSLMQVARNPAVPDYLRQRVVLAAWTRAILLKNDPIAREAAVEVEKSIPEAAVLLESYLKAGTAEERDLAATYALLKLPFISPYIAADIPDFYFGEDGYYFAQSWWCTLPQTDYDEDINEKPKQVRAPIFLPPRLLAAAEKERQELIALGDAKQFLGKRVLEWAKQRPGDSRLPEALFIAAKANESYKYGCNGWEHDEELNVKLEGLLLENYSNSPWAAKLREREQ